MKYVLLALLVTALFAAGAAQPVRASGHAATTPTDAVTILVRSGTPQGPVRSDCDLTRRTYRACPVTDRLRQRMEQLSQAPFGEPVSRGSGQDLSPRIGVTEVSKSGGVALVNASFEGGLGAVNITFVVRGQGREWLVDDSYCAGQPETTIYRSPIPILPCGVSPGPLPNAAASSVQGYAWLPALVGIVVAGVGLVIRRRAHETR